MVPEYLAEVSNYLSSLDEILELHEVLSRFDLLLKIRARNLVGMGNMVVNKDG